MMGKTGISISSCSLRMVAREGVSPPWLSSAQSSMRSAPPRSAASAASRVSTVISRSGSVGTLGSWQGVGDSPYILRVSFGCNCRFGQTPGDRETPGIPQPSHDPLPVLVLVFCRIRTGLIPRELVYRGTFEKETEYET